MYSKKQNLKNRNSTEFVVGSQWLLISIHIHTGTKN